MQVKTYVGASKPAYRLVIPSDRVLGDLSERVQTAAKNLGDLRFVHEIALDPENTFHATLLKQIAADGAALWKVDVKFEEITG